jgi:hypothetical protein
MIILADELKIRGRMNMCVTSARADLSGTRIYFGLATVDGKPVHVLAYQNQPRNQSTGANAMLLHVHAEQPFGQGNLVDTTSCPHILDDMLKAVTGGQTMGRSMQFRSLKALVFDHDIYTIVLAKDANDIIPALDQVPARKRPVVSAELMAFYADHYPGWPVMLCCFDNSEAQKAAPLLLYYTPKDTERVCAPGIDCHTGGVPDLASLVDVESWAFIGTTGKTHHMAIPVSYGDTLPPLVRQLLPDAVIAMCYRGKYPNGDYVFEPEALHNPGYPQIVRTTPRLQE